MRFIARMATRSLQLRSWRHSSPSRLPFVQSWLRPIVVAPVSLLSPPSLSCVLIVWRWGARDLVGGQWQGKERQPPPPPFGQKMTTTMLEEVDLVTLDLATPDQRRSWLDDNDSRVDEFCMSCWFVNRLATRVLDVCIVIFIGWSSSIQLVLVLFVLGMRINIVFLIYSWDENWSGDLLDFLLSVLGWWWKLITVMDLQRPAEPILGGGKHPFLFFWLVWAHQC